MTKKENFLKSIIKENPVFVSLLGMCPTLATTSSIEAAFGMGILFTLVLLGSNILVSLLRKVIPSQIKIPAYIVIIATFVTILSMLAEAFIPELYKTLGVFISLIVVNCIILGRAEAFASKNNVIDSFIDAISNGIGFTLALLSMAFIREIIGTGQISIGKIFTFIPHKKLDLFSNYSIYLFVTPAGGFLTLAIILGFIEYFKNKKIEKKAKIVKEEINKIKERKEI